MITLKEIIAWTLLVVVALLFFIFYPPPKEYIPVPQPAINAADWEGISKRLLREDYHLDPLRREIIEDFINRNKGRTQ